MPSSPLHEPWDSFLRELDQHLTTATELHCFGGFVVAEYYGLVRSTADIDVFESRGTDPTTLVGLAGKGSPLHKKHRVYIDMVTVADVPEDYESRLIAVFEGRFKHLNLKAFERHDLVLAKLVRNTDRDRQDVEALARGPGLDVNVLRHRYEHELGPILGRPEREDLTLEFWIEIIEEITNKKKAVE
jgi:hypothetical protein